MNDRIRISPVRLIGVDGEQVGIVPTSEALQRARELELDLVEVSPNSRPPVCRIMDFGKYKYELSKKDRAAKKKQQSTQLKEMRYRPKIDEHDYSFKTKHVRSFLEAGNKVKAFVMFRGREMAHVEFGRQILSRLSEDIADVATVDVAPSLEGNRMSMILSPRPEVLKKAQAKGPSKDQSKASAGEEEEVVVEAGGDGDEADADSVQE